MSFFYFIQKRVILIDWKFCKILCSKPVEKLECTCNSTRTTSKHHRDINLDFWHLCIPFSPLLFCPCVPFPCQRGGMGEAKITFSLKFIPGISDIHRQTHVEDILKNSALTSFVWTRRGQEAASHEPRKWEKKTSDVHHHWAKIWVVFRSA